MVPHLRSPVPTSMLRLYRNPDHFPACISATNRHCSGVHPRESEKTRIRRMSDCGSSRGEMFRLIVPLICLVSCLLTHGAEALGEWFTLSGNFDGGYRNTQFFE